MNPRFADDGIAAWEMSPVQEKYRNLLLEKVRSGVYALETVRQCLCGETRLEQLAAKDRFGLPFGSFVCTACGLVITSPRLAGRALAEFYNNEYHPLIFGGEEAACFNPVKGDQGRRIYEYVRKSLGDRQRIRVAEIGCGRGSNLVQFAEQAAADGIEAVTCGCDYSERCVEFAVNALKQDVLRGGAHILLKSGKQADVILLSHILEHLPDIPEQLAVVKQLCANDARVYVEVPGILDIRNRTEYKCDFLLYRVCAHTYDFCMGTLSDVMARAGFRLISGDEQAKAVFVASKDAVSVGRNRYGDIMDCLADLEGHRHIYCEYSQKIADLNRECQRLAGLVAAKDRAYKDIRNSMSWQITAPLRKLANLFMFRRRGGP